MNGLGPICLALGRPPDVEFDEPVRVSVLIGTRSRSPVCGAAIHRCQFKVGDAQLGAPSLRPDPTPPPTGCRCRGQSALDGARQCQPVGRARLVSLDSVPHGEPTAVDSGDARSAPRARRS